MVDAELDAEIEKLSEELLAKSDILRSLRNAADCDNAAVAAVNAEAKDLNRKLGVLLRRKDGGAQKVIPDCFDRPETESLMKRRFFVTPSFEIYGGVGGLFDFGPPGCAVKTNVIQMWRNHFVVQESMMELEGTCLTPEPVLKASGHVDKFTDLMVKDVVTSECFRADHLLKGQLEKILDEPTTSDERRDDAEVLLGEIDELDQEGMDAALKAWEVKAPETNNDLGPSYPFNLMFGTQIGPSGLVKGYLRPETAQGIFVNFKRLLDFAGSRLPFACAQVGLSFRNEISPRAGLLRVREFMQAEIEHFVHPEQKAHPKFASVADYRVQLLPRKQQLTTRKAIEMPIGLAVAEGVIDNETLAFFIARTSMFTEMIGLKREFVRFRQHKDFEMAHYARECWDLEVQCSHGWVECAGLADRSCFDLQSHSESSKVELNAREVYAEPKQVEYLIAAPIKGIMGKSLRQNAQKVIKTMESWSNEKAGEVQQAFDSGAESVPVDTADGSTFEITKNMVKFEKGVRKESGRNFYPSVIEPSFGIGRLLYCIFEHTFYIREGDDEKKAVLRLPPAVAPIKAAVLPLSKNDVFTPMLNKVGDALGRAGLIYRIDDTGASIGKRYARFDELGTPFGVTVDFDSAADESVTLRERDSMKQVRGHHAEITQAVSDLVTGRMTWSEVESKFPAFNSSEE